MLFKSILMDLKKKKMKAFDDKVFIVTKVTITTVYLFFFLEWYQFRGQIKLEPPQIGLL